MSHDCSTPIRPITERSSLAPSSCTRRSVGWSYDRPTLIPPNIGGGRPTGLPRSASMTSGSVGLASPPVDLDLRQETGQFLYPSTYLLVKPRTGNQSFSTFGLLFLTTVISDSRMLTILPNPSSRRPGTGRRNRPSRLSCHPVRDEATLSQGLRTSPLPATHALVGY